MKDVQCYELIGGIALKNHAFSFSFHRDVEKPLSRQKDYFNSVIYTQERNIKCFIQIIDHSNSRVDALL